MESLSIWISVLGSWQESSNGGLNFWKSSSDLGLSTNCPFSMEFVFLHLHSLHQPASLIYDTFPAPRTGLKIFFFHKFSNSRKSMGAKTARANIHFKNLVWEGSYSSEAYWKALCFLEIK